MKLIGIVLLILGLLGILMASVMFGDIGVACGMVALYSLITGLVFFKIDKFLKHIKSE